MSLVVFEVVGTGREKMASEQMAAVVLKRLAQAVDGADVQSIEVLDVETPRPYERVLRIAPTESCPEERLVHISKGTA